MEVVELESRRREEKVEQKRCSSVGNGSILDQEAAISPYLLSIRHRYR